MSYTFILEDIWVDYRISDSNVPGSNPRMATPLVVSLGHFTCIASPHPGVKWYLVGKWLNIDVRSWDDIGVNKSNN